MAGMLYGHAMDQNVSTSLSLLLNEIGTERDADVVRVWATTMLMKTGDRAAFDLVIKMIKYRMDKATTKKWMSNWRQP